MNKTVAWVIGIIVITAGGALAYSFLGGEKSPRGAFSVGQDKPRVIEENLTLPDTTQITAGEGRVVTSESLVQVPLVPKNEGEKVIVAKAVLTVKGSVALALPEAQKWAADAKLAFVKSLGAVTLEGKSSQWQLAFASATKKNKGYEVIVQEDVIASKKEIDSNAAGASMPADLLDSDSAIRSLQELPQFSDATISSISLYYNTDGGVWRYAIATSKGTTSVSAQ